MNPDAAPIVAVVDDDDRVLESLQELLESAGYVARSFSSAADFLRSGDIANVTCLISDLRMPVIDGWELEATVFGIRPELPVILFTGDDVARREAVVRRLEGRERALFTKPFNAPELLAAVRSAVGR